MLKDGGRQPSDREERSLSASTVIARWQGNGEPCKSRGLRTFLWAVGVEIPPTDPAAWNPIVPAHAGLRPPDRSSRVAADRLLEQRFRHLGVGLDQAPVQF